MIRWPIATIWGMVILSLVGLSLIGSSYDPNFASRPIKGLFLILIFFAVTSLVAAILYAVDVARIEGIHHFLKAYFLWDHSYIAIAIRRGVIISVILVGLMIFGRLSFLNVYSLGAILIAGVSAEIFLMKDDSYK